MPQVQKKRFPRGSLKAANSTTTLSRNDLAQDARFSKRCSHQGRRRIDRTLVPGDVGVTDGTDGVTGRPLH